MNIDPTERATPDVPSNVISFAAVQPRRVVRGTARPGPNLSDEQLQEYALRCIQLMRQNELEVPCWFCPDGLMLVKFTKARSRPRPFCLCTSCGSQAHLKHDTAVGDLVITPRFDRCFSRHKLLRWQRFQARPARSKRGGCL